MDKKKLAEEAMQRHAAWHGKIEVVARCQLNTREDLALAYTPGVAAPCLAIQEQPELSFTLTRRSNLVAVVTDGTAVLGLGDIGPEAGMPVMEGKCALFKAFADVDAFPLCIRSKDPDEIVRTVSLLAGSFGGINLEDIAAPRCFEIERRLQEVCDIPVFHDDQHGTAVVVAAALLNALRVVGKDIGQVRTVISGAGAAGISIGRHLLRMGVRDLTMVDRFGALYPGKPENNPAQEEMAALTNPRRLTGDLGDCLRVCRRVGTRHRVAGHGAFHGARRHRVPHGKSRSGDSAGACAGGGSPDCRLRTVGLSEPDKQCVGFPRHFPWRTGLPCHLHQ